MVSGHYRSVRYRHVGASSGKPTVNPIELGGPGSALTLRRSDSASPAVDDRSPGFGAAARSTANAADHDCTATTAAITTTAAMGATTATGTDDDGGRDGDGDRRERRAAAGRTTAEDSAAVTAMVAAAAAAVTTIHSPRRPGRTRGGEGNGGDGPPVAAETTVDDAGTSGGRQKRRTRTSRTGPDGTAAGCTYASAAYAAGVYDGRPPSRTDEWPGPVEGNGQRASERASLRTSDRDGRAVDCVSRTKTD